MSNASPQLNLSPREVEGRATTHWDAESLILRTKFEYGEPAVRPTYRVILGGLDILLGDRGRWQSLEIRTNPADWLDASLPDLSPAAPQVWAEFRLAFDENNIATVRDALVVPVWDERARRVALRLERARPSVAWSALADTVALGLDAQGRLSEVRLDAPSVRV
jgi:hypothetical protein